MKIRADLLKKELAKRAEVAKTAAAAPKFTLEAFCFDRQLAFLKDPSRFKTAVCSRRSGKSVGCAADLIDTALTQQGDVAYITLSRKTAKKIIWRELLKINKQFDLGGVPDNTELNLTMPNGNIIYVSGAKDATEIEKWRGLALRKVYIDESQSFRAYIQELIEDVIEPALTDFYGSLCLIGTPGPVPAGYFYEMSQNPEWSHHKWTMQDNPHIQLKSGKEPIEIIKELAHRRGLTTSSPSIQREYFGQWVKDADSLVFKFDPLLNIEATLPPLSDMTFIFGIDIGYKDSDAIAVLGYHNRSKNVYLVDEYVQSKNDITSLVQQIEKMRSKYNPVKLIMDAGALGKKIQEEIRSRHGIPVDAAEKTRKFEYIALMNDDLRTGKLKAKPGTVFEEDCGLVQWNWDDPLKPKIDDRYHSDINDAVLYAWRECKHYFWTPTESKPHKDSDAYMKALEAKEAEEMELKKANQSQDEFTDVNDWSDLGIDDEWDSDFND